MHFGSCGSDWFGLERDEAKTCSSRAQIGRKITVFAVVGVFIVGAADWTGNERALGCESDEQASGRPIDRSERLISERSERKQRQLAQKQS